MSDNNNGVARKPDAGHQVAEDIVAQVETGPRHPDSRLWRAVITALCLMWSAFQLYIADNPFDSWQARSIHLAFALALVFLAYPAFKQNSPSRIIRSLGEAIPSRDRERHGVVLVYDLIFGAILITFGVWTLLGLVQLDADLGMMGGTAWGFVPWIVAVAALLEGARRVLALVNRIVPMIPKGMLDRFICGNDESRSNRSHIPVYDIVFAVMGALSALFIVFDYEGLITRQGLPLFFDVWVGVTCTILLLEAARRALGPALAVLAIFFLSYLFVGPFLPELIRHRGLAARLCGQRHLFVDLRDLRCAAGCLNQHHLPVRIVRSAFGAGRRRPVFHRRGVFRIWAFVNGGAKLVHPGGAKLVHLTLCGTRCWGVVPVVHRRDPRCFE